MDTSTHTVMAMKATIGGILLVAGMIALLKMPILGALLIGAGYFLFSGTTRQQRSDALGIFFGVCLVCLAVVSAISLF